MWDDINEINIQFDYWNATLSKLPRTRKRVLKQAIYMINSINLADDIQIAETYATAAIHFIGTIKDMVKQDLLDLNIFNEWNISKEQKLVTEDPLLKVLRVIRNYDVHYRTLEYELFDGMMYHIVGENIAQTEDNSLFFEEFTWEEYEKMRPKKKELTPEHLEWFNNQTRYWSVKYICYEAINRYCKYINSFITSMVTEKEK